MSEYIKVAVDAMGGDNAPQEISTIKESRKIKKSRNHTLYDPLISSNITRINQLR